MNERPRVAVVGSLHYDIMVEADHLPRRDETAVGTRWYPKFGGKGGNQAVAAALPGGDPLAAALAAGETPSPQLVAAAGETGQLSLREGIIYLSKSSRHRAQNISSKFLP